MIVARNVEEFRSEIKRAARDPKLEGCDLRLMSSVNDVNRIPTEGKNLIIVANVQGALHVRAFAADGKRFVDTDESQLPDKAPQITKLESLLSDLRDVPELPQSDKERVISTVTSIVGHTQLENKQVALVTCGGVPRDGGPLQAAPLLGGAGGLDPRRPGYPEGRGTAQGYIQKVEKIRPEGGR